MKGKIKNKKYKKGMDEKKEKKQKNCLGRILELF